MWVFGNPADGEAQVAFPFSGGDGGPENPPGFGECLIDFSSVRHACPEDHVMSIMELGEGLHGEAESWVHKPLALQGGDIDAPTKISTFTQKRKTSNPDERERAGKPSWRRRPLLTLEGPEDEPGKEVWGGRVGGRNPHVLSPWALDVGKR